VCKEKSLKNASNESLARRNEMDRGKYICMFGLKAVIKNGGK